MVMKVALLHLDLGIGGAEQLVVNVASAMQRIKVKSVKPQRSVSAATTVNKAAKALTEDGEPVEVCILTSHHDVRHCFEETKPDGTVESLWLLFSI